MSRSMIMFGAVTVFAVLLARSVLPQEAPVPEEKPDKPVPLSATMAEEMVVLRKLEGAWDVKATLHHGTQPISFEGTETARLVGNWVVSDFTGTVQGAARDGHGILGYDAARKKFVSVWVDATTTTLEIADGVFDAPKRTLTFLQQPRDAQGKAGWKKLVTEFKEDGTLVRRVSKAGPEGKEALEMEMVYTKKAG